MRCTVKHPEQFNSKTRDQVRRGCLRGVRDGTLCLRHAFGQICALSCSPSALQEWAVQQIWCDFGCLLLHKVFTFFSTQLLPAEEIPLNLL